MIFLIMHTYVYMWVYSCQSALIKIGIFYLILIFIIFFKDIIALTHSVDSNMCPSENMLRFCKFLLS